MNFSEEEKGIQDHKFEIAINIFPNHYYEILAKKETLSGDNI
jgi:hypothetical protein